MVAEVVKKVVLVRWVTLPDDCVVTSSKVVDSSVGLRCDMPNVVITSG